MPVLYCLSPLPTLFLRFYDSSSLLNRTNDPETRDNMLDAFFASRRRPTSAAAPPPVTSAPTISPCSSESLIGMYGKQLPQSDETPYSANRSSYSPGEARKSLMAYMDSDGSYAESVRSRPVSVVLRSGDAPDLGVAGGERDQVRTTAKSAPSTNESGGGFLASVWALGRYMTATTVESTREVINDVVTLAAGFAREKRSYAASMGSSANNDDFVESDSEVEEVEEREEEELDLDYREAMDKGKSKESDYGTDLEQEAAEPSSRELPTVAIIPVSPDPASVGKVEDVSPVDTRPILDRNQSKSLTELRQESLEVATAPPRSPSLTELKDAEKDARQDDIQQMLHKETELRDAKAATTIQRAWRGSKQRETVKAETAKAEPAPVVVEEPAPPKEEEAAKAATTIQRAWRGSKQREAAKAEPTPEPTPVVVEEPAPQEEDAAKAATTIQRAWRGSKQREAAKAEPTPVDAPAPEAPEKSPLRKNSVPAENLDDSKVGEPEAVKEGVDTESKAEVKDLALETVEPQEKVAEVSAVAAEPAVAVAAAVGTEELTPTKPEDIHPAFRNPFPVSVSSSGVASDELSKPIEPEVPVAVSAPPALETAVAREVPAEEPPTPSTPTKAPSITKTQNSIERRVLTAFRRDSVRRSMSMFSSKKDKKPPNPELPNLTPSAMELTPPPTPPMTEDQASLVERPKSRMSMFSLAKKVTEEKAKESASTTKDNDSALAELSSTLASETAKDVGEGLSTQQQPGVPKKRSLISVASSYQEADRPVTSSGPLPAVTEASDPASEDPASEDPAPETPKRRPTFRPFSSSGGKSRTQSWLSGRKPKVNEQGELVDPNGDDASSIAPSVDQTPATPDQGSVKERPKFLNAMKRAQTFSLGSNRSVSSSAVSMASTTATNDEAPPSPTAGKLKGAARMRAIARASTFIGRKKEKGKGKEVAATE
ncbi:hypothetical protein K440DRAFT_664510 [Wilcoxina mikolae CBS 423.85]|nr:hypothetical protein K440DRAFT_664510 [Wilcoxina mikolae CBS 423.85]